MNFDPKMSPNGIRQALGKLHAPRVFGRHRRSAMQFTTVIPVASVRQLGLSVVPFAMQAEGTTSGKWGSDEQISQDLARLGAGLATFPGRFDLTWPRLSSNVDVPFIPDAEIGGMVPLPALPSDMYDIVRSSENVSKLSTFFRLLANGQRKVILTALHAEGEKRSANSAWETHGFCEGIVFPWAEEHPKDEAEITGLHDYRRDVINLASEYHRSWMADLAVAIASLLRLVQDELAADGILLGDVVEGISLFHQPSMRCVWPGDGYTYTSQWQSGDATTSAGHWAGMWWSCASAFSIACRTWGLDVAIRLPSMGPHFEIDYEGIPRRHSLRYRLEFWDRFLREISAYSIRTWDGMVDRADVASALSFQWDHKSRADAVAENDPDQERFRLGPRHISHMMADADAIRILLDRRGFADTQLDLLQTGASVLDPDDFLPEWADGDREAFQATEVWRRLGGALACGTTRVGWQAWMSDSPMVTASEQPSREYYGMGLRSDAAQPQASAGEAAPRRSWFAFQRLAETLGAVTSGEILHPVTLPDEVTWEPNEERDLVVIFHYRLAAVSPHSTGDHVYLIVVDPTQETDRTFIVQASWLSGDGEVMGGLFDIARRAVVVATVPLAVSRGDLWGGFEVGGGSDLDLPASSALYEEDEDLLVDGRPVNWIGLRAGGVALVRSSEALSLDIQLAPSIGLFGGVTVKEIPEVMGPEVLLHGPGVWVPWELHHSAWRGGLRIPRLVRPWK